MYNKILYILYIMSAENCTKRLEKLILEYENLLDSYDDLYEQNMEEYTKLSSKYDVLVDLKNSSKYKLLQQKFDEIISSKNIIIKKMKECQELTNSSTIDLISKGIKLNNQVNTIENQSKKIKNLKEKKYSSSAQTETIQTINNFLKKNILVMGIIMVILIIILNYLIFSR